MRRVNLFIVTLTTSTIALAILTLIGTSILSANQPTQQHSSNWMNQIMQNGGMMNQNYAAANSFAPYYYALLAVVIAVTAVGTVGLGYSLFFRAKMTFKPQHVMTATVQPMSSSAITSISKTLTAEELKIIEVLENHDGEYLQKYITKETGLSRLKTHRVITRLTQRGILTMEKTGNTNQVCLANWLKQNQNN